MKRFATLLVLLIVVSMLLPACAAPAPQVVKEIVTVEVEKKVIETVQVEVLKSVNGSAFQSMGALTQAVPLGTKNSSTDFKFSYTYSDTDRGSVVFKAVATIQDFRDCVPSNNEMSASPLTVK